MHQMGLLIFTIKFFDSLKLLSSKVGCVSTKQGQDTLATWQAAVPKAQCLFKN